MQDLLQRASGQRRDTGDKEIFMVIMYINLLIKIKNAQAAGKKTLKSRYSRMDKAVIDILEKERFVGNSEIKGRPSKRYIFAELRAKRKIEGVKFLSKPSVHTYKGYKELKRVKGGHGILMVSTAKGIMTGENAKKEKIGGELLFEIY